MATALQNAGVEALGKTPLQKIVQVMIKHYMGRLRRVDPEKYDEMSAPRLAGKSVPPDMLRVIYSEAATNLLDARHDGALAPATR